MMFQWDSKKNKINFKKHGIDFQDCISLFDSMYLEKVDTRKEYGEVRRIALGICHTKILFVVYTIRRKNYRIISARLANRIERRVYHEFIRKGYHYE